MVKQRNIFTGKVDILTDATDDQGRAALALHELGAEAGKIVKVRTTALPIRVKEPTNQTALFL